MRRTEKGTAVTEEAQRIVALSISIEKTCVRVRNKDTHLLWIACGISKRVEDAAERPEAAQRSGIDGVPQSHEERAIYRSIELAFLVVVLAAVSFT